MMRIQILNEGMKRIHFLKLRNDTGTDPNPFLFKLLNIFFYVTNEG